MIRRALSLRLRLFAVILVPLVLMALALGAWRYLVAQRTAENLFDRTLLSAALAISRDVAVSGGDALSAGTRDLIRDAAGGEVFYHATGPDGIYVTGYAYPPTPAGSRPVADGKPHYAMATYRSEPVRVLRLTERVTIDTLSGDATVTVWQRLSDRNALTRRLAMRAAALIGALLGALALVVWFGVKLGLRPLTDLHQAIAARSADDLSPIRRPVPEETRNIVATLNRLLRQVDRSLADHQAFISDAAHQLRNPAASVLSLAESVRDAKDSAERERRIAELVQAARESSRMTEQLLSLERLRQTGTAEPGQTFDLNAATEAACAAEGARVLTRGVDFELATASQDLPVRGNPVFVGEAVKNLIDNALRHGGPELRRIRVCTRRAGDEALLTVSDDGVGLAPAASDVVFRRFSQLEPSAGSGLGLAIAASVAGRHGGTLRIDPVEAGASLTMALPLAL